MRPNPTFPILLVDDEARFLDAATFTLSGSGLTNVRACNDAREATNLARQYNVGVALVDMMMPHKTGSALLEELQNDRPDMPVILLTGVDDLSSATAAMQAGAFDYLVKPIDDGPFIASVRRAVQTRQLYLENEVLGRALWRVAAMTAAPGTWRRWGTKLTHLITGPNANERKDIARKLHGLSNRAGRLVELDLTRPEDALIGERLFGSQASPPPPTPSPGAALEHARDGTLYIDDVCALPASAQILKLASFLDQGTYCPVGSSVAAPIGR